MNTILKNLINEIEETKKENFTKEEIISIISQIDIHKNNPSLNSNGVLIDTEKRVVVCDNNEIIMPRKEFELLYYLVSNKNRCVKRDEILSNVWGQDVYVGDRTIDVHIRKIRTKINVDCIKTETGIGYKWVE